MWYTCFLSFRPIHMVNKYQCVIWERYFKCWWWGVIVHIYWRDVAIYYYTKLHVKYLCTFGIIDTHRYMIYQWAPHHSTWNGINQTPTNCATSSEHEPHSHWLGIFLIECNSHYSNAIKANSKYAYSFWRKDHSTRHCIDHHSPAYRVTGMRVIRSMHVQWYNDSIQHRHEILPC